jgi:hypothetical protein
MQKNWDQVFRSSTPTRRWYSSIRLLNYATAPEIPATALQYSLQPRSYQVSRRHQVTREINQVNQEPRLYLAIASIGSRYDVPNRAVSSASCCRISRVASSFSYVGAPHFRLLMNQKRHDVSSPTQYPSKYGIQAFWDWPLYRLNPEAFGDNMIWRGSIKLRFLNLQPSLHHELSSADADPDFDSSESLHEPASLTPRNGTCQRHRNRSTYRNVQRFEVFNPPLVQLKSQTIQSKSSSRHVSFSRS